MIRILLKLYNLAWAVILPFLRKSPRISQGWKERILDEFQPGPYDLWIQAASGGESMLTNMIIDQLAESLPEKVPGGLKILATSGTKQGIDSLNKGVLARNAREYLTGRADVAVSYFPFDAPDIMQRAFEQFSPRLAVIVETELWPNFLVCAKQMDVPVLLVNGRMSEKSFRSYKHLHFFFSRFGPEKVYAISQLDGERFSQVIGRKKVEVIQNIKFDRIETQENNPGKNPLSTLLPDDKAFIVLGSIRKEEEDKILDTLDNLLIKRSDITIGLFPKHIERADHWIQLLSSRNISSIKRSQTYKAIPADRVIVWDVFGELAGAYALARAAFVGGSLINLGGQNFLEPLVFGLRPIIGPYWKNFAWVGREIVSSGLVTEVEDENELTAALIKSIDDATDKEEIMKQVQQFFNPKKGGTELVSSKILRQLQASTN